MIPTTRDEFIQHCRRDLGEPVIQVNTAIEQDDDRVDEALSKFYEFHYDASELVYILYDIDTDDKALGYITLDEDIVGVTDVFLPNSAQGMFSIEYQTQLENMYTSSTLTSNDNMSYYVMTQNHLKLIEQLFTPMRQYTFNPITHKLIILGGLQNTDNIAGGVVIKAYKKIYGETSEIPASDNTNQVVGNIWCNRWLQKYCTALIKRQWGSNLIKYQQLQMLGGVAMNGDAIYQAALVEIKELEDELINTYSLPPSFIIG